MAQLQRDSDCWASQLRLSHLYLETSTSADVAAEQQQQNKASLSTSWLSSLVVVSSLQMMGFGMPVSRLRLMLRMVIRASSCRRRRLSRASSSAVAIEPKPCDANAWSLRSRLLVAPPKLKLPIAWPLRSLQCLVVAGAFFFWSCVTARSTAS